MGGLTGEIRRVGLGIYNYQCLELEPFLEI